LGKFEASYLFAYLIQFTPRRTASAGRESGLPQSLSSPSYVSAIGAAPCVRKKADSSSRVLPTRASESIGFHRNLCKSQRLPTFFWQPAAKSANDCPTANSSLPATYNIYPPESGNRPGGRCAASCGKTSKIPQAFHRLWNKSCG